MENLAGWIYYDTVSIEVYDRVEALKMVGWKIKLGGSITTLFLYKLRQSWGSKNCRVEN